MPDEIGGVSYEAMLAIARRQLLMGMSVIADSPLGNVVLDANASAMQVGWTLPSERADGGDAL